MDITLALFILVYIAMGVGHLPGFQVDRTGAALVGAMLLIVFGRITPTQAWASIDVNTIGLLFGLMVVSAAFVVGGFYDWTARKAESGSFPAGILFCHECRVHGYPDRQPAKYDYCASTEHFVHRFLQHYAGTFDHWVVFNLAGTCSVLSRALGA